MHLPELNRPVHRNDILVAQQDPGRKDATDRASTQAQEEMNWELVAMV